MTNDERLVVTVAVIGGTGREGTGLAQRWALKGYRVIIGSRDAERAQNHAREVNARLGQDGLLTGMGNPDAAAAADLVVLSVPYSAHRNTLEAIKDQLRGKILVDITVPAEPPNLTTVLIPEGHSAALEAQQQLGDAVRVVSAFQDISFSKLADPENVIDSDVFVTGDDAEAKEQVFPLVEAAGMRPLDAGPLINSVAAEALASVLIYIGRKYKVKGAGIRITGL